MTAVPKEHRTAIVVALVCLGIIAAVAATFAVGNRVAVRALPTKTEVTQEVTKQVAPKVEAQVAPRVERAQSTSDQVARDLTAARDDLLAKQATIDARLQELEARGPVVVASLVPAPIVVVRPPASEPAPVPGSPGPTGEPGSPGIPGLTFPFPIPTPQPPGEPGACRAVRLELIKQPVLCLG